MKIPCWWPLMFEYSNRKHDYFSHTRKTIDLHLDGDMRGKECCIRVQSESVLPWALHIKRDIVKQTSYSSRAFSNGRFHCVATGEISSSDGVPLARLVDCCEMCDTGTMKATHVVGISTPPTRPDPSYAKTDISRLLQRSQTTVYSVLLDDMRTWNREKNLTEKRNSDFA